MRTLIFRVLVVTLGCGLIFPSARLLPAADSATAKTESTSPAKFDSRLYQKTVKRGVDYLLNHGQAPDGSYGANISPAVTAICVDALLRSGRSPDEPAIAKSLKYVEGFVQPDGGIYKPGSAIQNYETSIAIMCLAEANKDGRYKDQIKAADQYVKTIQWGADGKIDESNVNYGGAGYGRSKTRPDLSNTGFLLDALQAAGDDANDEAVKRALVFVSRCQNLPSQYNTTAMAAKNPDGGFFYTIADGGSSPAGKSEDGGLRSYGSMTYVGLKSMIFAGLGPEDERVKAAVNWVKNHYDLSSNPGMGQAGLYYGYHSFAKALSALGGDMFTDAKGVQHPWKAELLQELAKRQQDNGSWANLDKRWDEGDADLVTAYALLTLRYCKPTSGK
jgi:squalene-hopene/tetraprenyl-beta-curcumene cyclase